MFTALFDNPGFMPHIHCYLADAPLVWTMVVTDMLIGLSYFAISIALWALVRKIRIKFSFVGVCFGIFIGACGATHFMEVWTLWHPDYWQAAALKVVTAAASVATAIYLFRLRQVFADFTEAARLSDKRKDEILESTKDVEKRVREELEKSEKRYATLTASIPQLVWTCLPDGRCDYLSKQWEDYTGSPASEQLDMNWLDRVIHPDDRERTLKHWMGAVEGRHDYDIEYRIKRHDGEFRWFKTRGIAMRDSAGKIVSWLGTCTDIHEDINLRKSLQQAEAKFRTITDAMPQMVWSTQPDGFHDFFNKRWYEFTGVPEGSTDGEGWNEIFHSDDQEKAWGCWRHSLATGENYEIEYRLKHRSGEYRWVLGRAIAIRNDEGQITRWMGTCTDIDELREARNAAESANEAKSHFLANMSHEIRTPVGAITGFAEMLNQPGHSDSDRQNFTMIVERNSRHLLRLIDDILDLSKVEAGKIAFENENFNFNEFLSDFDAVMSLKAAEKGIQFVMKTLGPIPEFALGDQMRLKQILTNVAGNSVKFTHKGSVTAEFTYDDEFLKVLVTDTGIGIAKDHIGNLFKPFSQADPSLTRQFGGTGLGLVLSKRLANQFGGDLILEKTEFGRGSTFALSVRLPLAKDSRLIGYVTPGPIEVSLSPEPSDTGVLKGVTVVLVEDSPDNRTLISTYLKKTGVRLIMARDGQEGYTRAMKSLPDVVLMDIQMPKMDGHEATIKLRADGFKNPIIALTAHAMREERDRCFASGCTDYLTKPLNRDQLIEAIAKSAHSSKKAEEELSDKI